MNTNKSKLAFTVMLILACTTGFADDTPNIRVVGHYLDAMNVKTPLILNSHDYGASWAFDRNLLGINTSASLNDVDCTPSSCNAVGSIGEAGHTRPLILHHSYKSSAWEINELKNLPQFDEAYFNRVDCFISMCFAQGVGVLNGKSQALLYTGDLLDGRDDIWRPVQLDDDVQSVELLERGARYVGVFKSKDTTSYFVYSNNNGYSWNKAVIDNAPGAHVTIADLKCEMNYCVAVGKTSTNDHDWSAALFHSADSGKHWRIIPDVVEKDATLQSITYADGWGWSHWVAAGTHASNDGRSVPLFIKSDGYDGEEWSVKKSDFTLAKEEQVYEISSTRCTGLDCVAVGRAGPANQYAKVIALKSSDAGTSWEQTTDIPVISAPLANSVKLYCTYAICTLVVAKDGSWQDYPEILNTQDRGKSWTAINNVVGMPKATKVQLTGVSGSKVK